MLAATLSFLFGLLSALILKAIYTSYPSAYFVVEVENGTKMVKVAVFNGFSRIVEVRGGCDDGPNIECVNGFAVPNMLTELPPFPEKKANVSEDQFFLKISPNMVWLRKQHPFLLRVKRVNALPK